MKPSFAVLLGLLAPACGDNNTGTPVTPDAPDPDAPASACAVTPGAWSAPNFATNAAEALALRAQLDTLTGNPTMRGAETDNTVTMIDEVSDLEAVYDAGTPVLSSKVSPAFQAVIDDTFADFVAIVAAGPVDLINDSNDPGTDGWTPGVDGGLFSTARRAGYNAGGIEVRQIVDKGLFGGALMYRYALEKTTGAIDEAAIDSIVAAWGGNDMLSTTGLTDSANYSFQMGFHAQIASALTNAKAYAASPDCVAERDEALVTAFRLWEQSMFARTTFYSNRGVTLMANATTDDERSTALHEYSEGLGLAMGFHGLENPTTGPLANAGRRISDSDIDAMLTSLGVVRTDLSTSTIGTTYVLDTPAWQTGVEAVETRMKQVFQIDDAVIAAYRAPTSG